MGKTKPNSVADQIMKKFGWTLPYYAKARNISLSSLVQKYYSVETKLILKEDGIDLAKAGVEKENATN